jgi:thiamine-phosphate pyrophosphorylase
MKTSPAIYRLLDANLNRAREGLRVIEDWCRFGLDNGELSATCKSMRQTLGQWHKPEFRSARDTAGDVGTAITHPQEALRSDVRSVLQANLCRVEESLRVLEEYGKVYESQMGAVMKQLRYQTYQLDHAIMNPSKNRHDKLKAAQLYLVTSPSDTLLETVEAALQGGLTLVQYRDKTEDDDVRYSRALALKNLCDRYDALFIVNDRIDIALAVDADGVHLGQHDLPYAFARRMLGPEKIIGRSTTNPDEFVAAMAQMPDYIGVGPVHETPTKAGKAAAGYDYVRYAAAHCTIPWFAIGGIDMDNVKAAIEAGATRVSVVRAIMAAPEPKLTTQYLLSQLCISPVQS